MREQEQLLRAIREDPGDDTVRLAYADWLSEHGDEPRAEFIRVQVEIATLVCDFNYGGLVRPQGWCVNTSPPPGVPMCAPCARTDELLRKEASLVNCHQGWVTESGLKYPSEADLGRLYPTGFFRRGFVRDVELTCQAFCGYCPVCNGTGTVPERGRTTCPGPCKGSTRYRTDFAANLFRRNPIESVTLVNKAPASQHYWEEAGLLPLSYNWTLPRRLFEFLDGYGSTGARSTLRKPCGQKFYPTRAEATAALSRACLAYGRAEADKKSRKRKATP